MMVLPAPMSSPVPNVGCGPIHLNDILLVFEDGVPENLQRYMAEKMSQEFAFTVASESQMHEILVRAKQELMDLAAKGYLKRGLAEEWFFENPEGES